jgi:hypothetical protein
MSLLIDELVVIAMLSLATRLVDSRWSGLMCLDLRMDSLTPGYLG